MDGFRASLATQRWDDHRYYHHSRINQSLHLVSALSFVAAYALVFTHPVAAALLGWLVAMTTRQIGHFFFEPKCYDHVNQASHAHKEAIKVGYNLHRKVVLMSIWALSPVALWLDPTLLGLFEAPAGTQGWLHNLATSWIALGGAALLLRAVQLFVQQDVRTGVIWVTKILTDPFHDIKLYHRAPLYLLRGELIDPDPVGPGPRA